jgi:very-short-patch-repair endonuclease
LCKIFLTVDGYIEKYNICIEWDEKHHNSKKQKEHDNKKDIYLKENFNCHIIRINEKNFFKDINNNIIKICDNIKLRLSEISEERIPNVY